MFCKKINRGLFVTLFSCAFALPVSNAAEAQTASKISFEEQINIAREDAIIGELADQITGVYDDLDVILAWIDEHSGILPRPRVDKIRYIATFCKEGMDKERIRKFIQDIMKELVDSEGNNNWLCSTLVDKSKNRSYNALKNSGPFCRKGNTKFEKVRKSSK